MSAFLVNSKHIAEIVKYAKKKEFRYAYNCFTKKQIDCDPKNMVKLLKFKPILIAWSQDMTITLMSMLIM